MDEYSGFNSYFLQRKTFFSYLTLGRLKEDEGKGVDNYALSSKLSS